MPGNDIKELPLKHRVRRGAVAAGVGQVVGQVVSIASLALMLRLLVPADFGLVGMIAPVVMFLRVFTTFGLNVAAVQQRERNEEEASVLFWLTMLGGTVMAVAAAAAAPLVANFYACPELYDDLVQLTWALGGTLPVIAVGSQHLALLERRMRFDRLAVVRVASQATGAVAGIAAAWAGWGVWALVAQQYVELALLACLAWLAAGWLPSWTVIWRNERFDAAARSTLRFSGLFTAAAAILFLADHLDRVLLGRLVGADAVGLYGQAKNLMIKPVYLVTTPLSAIVLTSLARSAGKPRVRADLVAASYRILGILLLPMGAGLAVTGDDVMFVLGGENWQTAGAMLAVLSIGLFPQAVLIINGWVHAAVGRTDRWLGTSLITLAVLVIAFLAGASIGGEWDAQALGVAWSYAAATLLLLVPHTSYAMHSVETSLSRIARSMGRPLLASLVMGTAVYALSLWLEQTLPDMPAGRLTVEVAAGAAIYLALALPEIRWLRSQWTRM